MLYDLLKRIFIKIRTSFMGGLVVSVADEHNTFRSGKDNHQFFERISDRVMGRLNNDNEIPDMADLLLIRY